MTSPYTKIIFKHEKVKFGAFTTEYDSVHTQKAALFTVFVVVVVFAFCLVFFTPKSLACLI